LALSYYKARMDEVVGPEKAYVKEAALQAVHDALYIAAFEQFDEIATMGKWCESVCVSACVAVSNSCVYIVGG
jgi:hypothetical protein